MPILFDCGTEVMLGNYYNTPSSCFVSQDTNSFGLDIARHFNNSLDIICDDIIKGLKKENFDDILEVEIEGCSKQCFSQESKVEFNMTHKYIKFPYFSIPALNGFQIGIDINPCIGTQGNRTKIYGIFRYHEEPCTIDFIKRFSRTSLRLCTSIVDVIAEQYFNYIKSMFRFTTIDFNDFYSIYSIGIGSNGASIQKYIDLSNNTESFEALYSSNKDAQEISSTLLDLCRIASNNSSDKYWWTKNTFIYDGTDESTDTGSCSKSTQKIDAFVGRHGSETRAFFIALVNSKPQLALRPLNIGLINKY